MRENPRQEAFVGEANVRKDLWAYKEDLAVAHLGICIGAAQVVDLHLCGRVKTAGPTQEKRSKPALAHEAIQIRCRARPSLMGAENFSNR